MSIKKKTKDEEMISGLLRSDFLYYLPLDQDSSILEIGCGLGTHAFNVASFVSEVVAIDPSSENVNFCKRREDEEGTKNIQFLHCDFASFVKEKRLFDVIIIGETFGYRDLKRNLGQILQLLNPGGALYFGLTNRGFFLRRRLGQVLKRAGFTGKADVYILYPNQKLPRFMIPFEDMFTLKFIGNIISADKGLIGIIIRLACKSIFIRKFIRMLFTGYGVFLVK